MTTSPAPDASPVVSDSGPLVRVDHGHDGVVTITLENGKVNPLCLELLHQLEGAVTALDSPRVVVITGGPRVFAAGADISEFAAGVSGGDAGSRFALAPPGRIEEISRAFLDALGAVQSLPCPTIASIGGFALGGGCELALACDLRIASERARFGQPEILLGIIPGGGGTQRLARLVGASIAKDLVFSGRQIEAAEALRIGLVNRVVPHEELADATSALAGELAAGPREALALAKDAIDRGLDVTLDAGLRIEAERFVRSFTTRDAAVGVASFLDSGPGHARFD